MNNANTLTYVFLILTLMTICCHARARSKDWQDISYQDEDQNSFERLLVRFVKKRDGFHGCMAPGASVRHGSGRVTKMILDLGLGRVGSSRVKKY